MSEQEVLNSIWGGSVESRALGDMSPLGRVVEALMACPTVGLVAEFGITKPLAALECEELLPGATLGDILFEELDIEVPENAIIFIEPKEFAERDAYSGAELGQILGNMLVELGAEQSDGTLSATTFKTVLPGALLKAARDEELGPQANGSNARNPRGSEAMRAGTPQYRFG